MRPNPVWAEALQLVPVLVLAFPIIARGEVELSSLGVAFGLAASLALAVAAGIRAAGHLLNPILVGTYVWLGLGALGFAIGVPALAEVLAETQGFALFAIVGMVLLAFLPTETGSIGARAEPAWVRRASLGLLAIAALALAWSWAFRHDVRLGGGLPFIVLNVVRRVAIARQGRS